MISPKIKQRIQEEKNQILHIMSDDEWMTTSEVLRGFRKQNPGRGSFDILKYRLQTLEQEGLIEQYKKRYNLILWRLKK